MPVDRVDGSWGVIDNDEFNLFTRRFRKPFCKERIDLLGLRRRGEAKGKDNTERMSLFMLCIACLLSVMWCDSRLNRCRVADTHLEACGNLWQIDSNR
jgi:hypothetical protein